MIDSLLSEAGAAADERRFHEVVRGRIGELIPVDLPPPLLSIAEESGFHYCLHTWDESVTQRFNEHLRYQLPFGSDYLRTHPVIDVREFLWSVPYSELSRTYRIRYILGTFFSYYVCLVRTEGSPPFTERDCAVYRTIAPHISHFASLFRKLAQIPGEAISRAELAYDCRPLSRREAEIAKYMSLRMTAREIASLLRISPRTVERHVANAYEKLGVNNRADLLAKVYRVD